MISFIPEGETRGPAASASLIDGNYRFDNRNGPVAGKYRVLVVEDLSDQKAKAIESPTPSTGQPVAPAEWSFPTDVSADKAQLDFDVATASNAATKK
jgi:hypothetical protein